MDYSPSYTLAWNGLTPQMLLLNKNHFLYGKQEWCFLTNTQYDLLNRLKPIKLIENDEGPIFLLDFLCINNQIVEFKELIKDYPEIIGVSLILSKHSIDVSQVFCKMTPLHISAYLNDINHAITSVLTSMNCDLPDDNGETSLHIVARLEHYTVLEFLIRYGGNVHIKNKMGVTPKDLYGENNWKTIPSNYCDADVLVNLANMDMNNADFKCSTISMTHIMNITNFKKNSRFKITSLLSFYSQENETKKMVKRLDSIEKYRYRTFKDLDIRFEQHLYKKLLRVEISHHF